MSPVTSSARMQQLAPWMLVLASAVVAVVAYLQALHFPFVSDDLNYIVENTKLSGLLLTELWRPFIEPYNRFELLPLRDLSYWFDLTLFGLSPAAFRVHNIILYVLCLPLVYATTQGLWRYFRPADIAAAPWVAATVTSLFALHPAHVEAVVWISGRKDVLSGLFSLLALWFAVNARQEQGLSPRYASAALLALLVAMLSKATSVAIAPVISMLWIFFWRDISEQKKNRSLLLWPIASLLLAVGVALVFTASSSVKVPVHFGIEAVTRLFAVLGWMARLAISPESRHFFYQMFEDTKFTVMVALGAFILIAAVTAVVTILRKRSLEGFALVTFVLLCLPYFQLMPFLTNSLVADRFLFLAVFPVQLLVVALVWQLKPLSRTILLLAIVLPWGFQTAERPRDWRDFEWLIDTELHANPGYYQPVYQKILIQMERGLYSDAIVSANTITVPEFRNVMTAMIQASYAVNTVTTGKSDEALALLQNFEVAINQLPPQSKWNTTMLQVKEGCQYILSLKGMRLAKKFPEEALVRYKAGLWNLEVGNYQVAITNLRAAIESQRLPESLRGTAYKNLGVALLNSGYAAEAELLLRAALEHSPPNLLANCVLADMYKRAGRTGEAVHVEAECRSHVSSTTSGQ